MNGKQSLTALSLGGGVQSTVLALLLDRGLLPGYPLPDVAIFADTQWEPRAVYDNIEWLKSQLSYPIVVATAGDLRQATHEFRTPHRQYGIYRPAAVHRWRSDETPMHSTLQNRADPEGSQRVLRVAGPSATGASIHGDQCGRGAAIKDSRHRWITHDYPLAYEGWRRTDCARWFAREYPGRTLSRSACVGCPFRSAGELVAVSKSDPDLFADACELDEKLRAMMLTRPERRVHGPVYLHRRPKPLAQAVALDTVEIESQVRFDLGDSWGDECEGQCGV